jgi:hypothetical protein
MSRSIRNRSAAERRISQATWEPNDSATTMPWEIPEARSAETTLFASSAIVPVERRG